MVALLRSGAATQPRVKLIKFINRTAIPDMSSSPFAPAPKPIANRVLPAWPVRALLAPPMRLVIFGGLPAGVRDRFNIAWTTYDQRAYTAVRTAIRQAWPCVPAPLKWHYTARKGWLRDTGKLPRRF